jgi:pseudouridine synthase
MNRTRTASRRNPPEHRSSIYPLASHRGGRKPAPAGLVAQPLGAASAAGPPPGPYATDAPDERTSPSAATQRLQAYLAHSGAASRRHAAAIIAAGRVRVNGQVVSAPGARIVPGRDTVLLDDRPLHPAPHRYVLLNKPAGYVSTTSDPHGRRTVLDLLPDAWKHDRFYPVGRLDYETEGLLLLTNDGDWALRLTHPRYGVAKEYHALVTGHPRPETLAALTHGIAVPGAPRPLVAAAARLIAPAGPNAWVALVLREGRNREARRLLAAVGHPVRRLIRVRIGPLRLQDLAPGQWRELTPAEVATLANVLSPLPAVRQKPHDAKDQQSG